MQYEIIDHILNYYDQTGRWMSTNKICDYFGITKKLAEQCKKDAVLGYTERKMEAENV